MRGDEGYTLLELLVVLTIMGLLTATVPVGLIQAVDSARFSGQVEDITSRLAAAHDRAIQSGDMITLRPKAITSVGTITIAAPVSTQIVFFPDGSSSGNIVVINYLGRHRSLKIDPITGLVRQQ